MERHANENGSRTLMWEPLMHLAAAEFAMGDLSCAAELVEKAVAEASHSGEPERRLAVSLNRLGVLCLYQGRRDEARPLLRRALEILERLPEPRPPETADVLYNLACLAESQEQARPLLEQALERCQSRDDPTDYCIAHVLDALGDAYSAAGKDPGAVYAWRRSLEFKERTFGPEDWSVSVTLTRLAGFYLQHGRYNDAEPLLLRALHIRETKTGPGDPSLLRAQRDLAKLYLLQGRHDRAALLSKAALATVAKLLDDTEWQILEHLSSLFEHCHTQSRYSDELSLWDRLLDIACCCRKSRDRNADLDRHRSELAALCQPDIH